MGTRDAAVMSASATLFLDQNATVLGHERQFSTATRNPLERPCDDY